MKSSRFFLPSSACLCASLALGVGALGCVTEDVDPATTATAGSGGSGAGGAATGAAGTSPGAAGTSPGAGGGGGAAPAGDVSRDPAFGVAMQCPPPQQALITDFTPPVAVADAGADAGAAATNVSFGDFTTTLSGGTYTYPNAAGDPYAVHSDISTGEWHISGTIGNYSGLALYFTGCNRIDASNYLGISFTIRGSVAMGNSLTFSVNTSSNDISFLWLNAQPTPPNPLAAANSGRCIPVMNQYDNTCAAPFLTVPVTETTTTIRVLWADLTGGRPSPSVNPAELTDIRWILPPPAGAGTPSPTTYEVDFYIDDLTFIAP